MEDGVHIVKIKQNINYLNGLKMHIHQLGINRNMNGV